MSVKPPEYKYRVIVYLQDNNTIGYWVSSAMKAREHAKRIITEGFQCDLGDGLTWYPPRWIHKVRIPEVPMPKRWILEPEEKYQSGANL